MSFGRNLADSQRAIPGCQLVMISCDNDAVAIGNDDDLTEGSLFILPRQATTDWVRECVDANRHEDGAPYGYEDFVRGVNAKLVTNRYVTCKGNEYGDFWCVGLADNPNGPSFEYDFSVREVNALVAFMSTSEFRELVKSPNAA